jgi:transcriptional regulator with XRE-family HTH domain
MEKQLEPSSRPSMATTADWEHKLGSAARRLRHRNRLTQAELAELANVSISAVKNLESGKGSSLATLIRVVRALGRTDWLESLLPPEPAISPMDKLRERRRMQAASSQRVRHNADVPGRS